MSHSSLEKILKDLPKFHRGDTETRITVSAQETVLRGSVFESVSNNLPACYGIEPVLARFLYDTVSEHSEALETGSGISI